MRHLQILGTDTDTGKTTFALLWLHLFGADDAYWKPVETGPSDTATIRELVPHAICHPPLVTCTQPVAPPLAAREEGKSIPKATSIAAQLPHVFAATEAVGMCDSLSAAKTCHPGKNLLVETFGSPFSPLNESELQIALIQKWAFPSLLISSSKLGAIGRTLSCLFALARVDITPFAVVLLGEHDAYAIEEIHKHSDGLPVFSIPSLRDWNRRALAAHALSQQRQLDDVRTLLQETANTKSEYIDQHNTWNFSDESV